MNATKKLGPGLTGYCVDIDSDRCVVVSPSEGGVFCIFINGDAETHLPLSWEAVEALTVALLDVQEARGVTIEQEGIRRE